MEMHALIAPYRASYVVEPRDSADVDAWQDFVLHVTDAYWKLPPMLRPHTHEGNKARCAYELFPEPGVLSIGGSASGLGLTISRNKGEDEATDRKRVYMSPYTDDFFWRLVLVLLHNLCPGHSRISASMGEVCWTIPVYWLKTHLGLELHMPQNSVNQYASQTPKMLMSDLLVDFFSDDERQLEAGLVKLTELESYLAQSDDMPSEDRVMADVTLGTSRSEDSLIELRNFNVLLDWVNDNVTTSIEDGEAVILRQHHLVELLDDVQSGVLTRRAGDRASAPSFYAETQLLSCWITHCLETLDFTRQTVFFYATW